MTCPQCEDVPVWRKICRRIEHPACMLEGTGTKSMPSLWGIAGAGDARRNPPPPPKHCLIAEIYCREIVLQSGDKDSSAKRGSQFDPTPIQSNQKAKCKASAMARPGRSRTVHSLIPLSPHPTPILLPVTSHHPDVHKFMSQQHALDFNDIAGSQRWRGPEGVGRLRFPQHGGWGGSHLWPWLQRFLPADRPPPRGLPCAPRYPLMALHEAFTRLYYAR